MFDRETVISILNKLLNKEYNVGTCATELERIYDDRRCKTCVFKLSVQEGGERSD